MSNQLLELLPDQIASIRSCGGDTAIEAANQCLNELVENGFTANVIVYIVQYANGCNILKYIVDNISHIKKFAIKPAKIFSYIDKEGGYDKLRDYIQSLINSNLPPEKKSKRTKHVSSLNASKVDAFSSLRDLGFSAEDVGFILKNSSADQQLKKAELIIALYNSGIRISRIIKYFKIHQFDIFNNAIDKYTPRLQDEYSFRAKDIVLMIFYDKHGVNIDSIFTENIQAYNFNSSDILRILTSKGRSENLLFLTNYSRFILKLQIPKEELVSELSHPRRCKKYREQLLETMYKNFPAKDLRSSNQSRVSNAENSKRIESAVLETAALLVETVQESTPDTAIEQKPAQIDKVSDLTRTISETFFPLSPDEFALDNHKDQADVDTIVKYTQYNDAALSLGGSTMSDVDDDLTPEDIEQMFNEDVFSKTQEDTHIPANKKYKFATNPFLVFSSAHEGVNPTQISENKSDPSAYIRQSMSISDLKEI